MGIVTAIARCRCHSLCEMSLSHIQRRPHKVIARDIGRLTPKEIIAAKKSPPRRRKGTTRTRTLSGLVPHFSVRGKEEGKMIICVCSTSCECSTYPAS